MRPLSPAGIIPEAASRPSHHQNNPASIENAPIEVGGSIPSGIGPSLTVLGRQIRAQTADVKQLLNSGVDAVARSRNEIANSVKEIKAIHEHSAAIRGDWMKTVEEGSEKIASATTKLVESSKTLGAAIDSLYAKITALPNLSEIPTFLHNQDLLISKILSRQEEQGEKLTNLCASLEKLEPSLAYCLATQTQHVQQQQPSAQVTTFGSYGVEFAERERASDIFERTRERSGGGGANSTDGQRQAAQPVTHLNKDHARGFAEEHGPKRRKLGEGMPLQHLGLANRGEILDNSSDSVVASKQQPHMQYYETPTTAVRREFDYDLQNDLKRKSEGIVALHGISKTTYRDRARSSVTPPASHDAHATKLPPRYINPNEDLDDADMQPNYSEPILATHQDSNRQDRDIANTGPATEASTVRINNTPAATSANNDNGKAAITSGRSEIFQSSNSDTSNLTPMPEDLELYFSQNATHGTAASLRDTMESTEIIPTQHPEQSFENSTSNATTGFYGYRSAVTSQNHSWGKLDSSMLDTSHKLELGLQKLDEKLQLNAARLDKRAMQQQKQPTIQGGEPAQSAKSKGINTKPKLVVTLSIKDVSNRKYLQREHNFEHDNSTKNHSSTSKVNHNMQQGAAPVSTRNHSAKGVTTAESPSVPKLLNPANNNADVAPALSNQVKASDNNNANKTNHGDINSNISNGKKKSRSDDKLDFAVPKRQKVKSLAASRLQTVNRPATETSDLLPPNSMSVFGAEAGTSAAGQAHKTGIANGHMGLKNCNNTHVAMQRGGDTHGAPVEKPRAAATDSTTDIHSSVPIKKRSTPSNSTKVRALSNNAPSSRSCGRVLRTRKPVDYRA